MSVNKTGRQNAVVVVFRAAPREVVAAVRVVEEALITKYVTANMSVLHVT